MGGGERPGLGLGAGGSCVNISRMRGERDRGVVVGRTEGGVTELGGRLTPKKVENCRPIHERLKLS